MNAYLPLVASLISAVIGGIIGSAIQYFLGRRAKKMEAFEKLQSDAYVDLIRSAASLTMAQKFRDDKAIMASLTLLLESKIRIGIYGTKDVAHAVGDYFEKYGDLSKKEDSIAFVNLMHGMRKNVVGNVTSADWVALSKILFSENLRSVRMEEQRDLPVGPAPQRD